MSRRNGHRPAHLSFASTASGILVFHRWRRGFTGMAGNTRHHASSSHARPAPALPRHAAPSTRDPRRARPRESRPPPAIRRSTPLHTPGPPSSNRPRLLGWPFPDLVPLVRCRRHRQARHRGPLPSHRIPPLLALQVPSLHTGEG